MLGRGYREFTQHFPQPGWVEHDPGGDLPGLARGDRARRWRRGRAARRARHHQPAGDRGAVGPPDARAGGAGDRLAGPPHQRALPRAAGIGRSSRCSASAPAWSPTPISPPPSSSGCSAIRSIRRRAGRGELAAGTVESWLVAQAHRRPGARHRPHQRQPHAAVRSPRARLASRAAPGSSAFPRELLPAIVPSAGVVGECDPIALRTSAADRRSRRRPAVGAVRPGLLRRRAGEEHLRHRRVPPGPPGRPAARSRPTACSPPRPAGRRASRPMRSRAASSWRARRCSGCVTGWGSSARRRRPTRWRGAFRTPAGCTSCRRSSGLGTPHWEPEARGTITGLTRGTTRAHLVARGAGGDRVQQRRAAARRWRGTAGQVPVLRVDGGAAANDWLMQFQADVLGIPVERPDMVETTALGAAGARRAGAGRVAGDRGFPGGAAVHPVRCRTMDPAERRRRLAEWERAVAAALAWARGSAP